MTLILNDQVGKGFIGNDPVIKGSDAPRVVLREFPANSGVIQFKYRDQPRLRFR